MRCGIREKKMHHILSPTLIPVSNEFLIRCQSANNKNPGTNNLKNLITRSPFLAFPAMQT